jgi:hypothetical protein
MIVSNKQNHIIHVPVNSGNLQAISNITLLPGGNEVDQDQWNLARENILSKIKKGLVVEEYAKIKEVEKEVTLHKTVEVNVEDPKTKEIKKEVKSVTEKKKVKKPVVDATPFKDLKAEEAEELVKETFSLDTLKKWKEQTSKESVRIVLLNQIEKVEKHGEEKKGDKK